MRTQRILIVTFSIMTFFSTSNLHSQPSNNICQEKGNQVFCTKGELQEINYLSDVHFDGTNILGRTKILGDIYAIHTHFNTLDTIGNFKANDIDVLGNAKMLGDLHFDQAVFHSDVNITGDVNVTNTTFMRKTKIVGNLVGMTTHFTNDLMVTSYKAELTQVSALNIDFMPSAKPQTLYLTGSIINGNITFSSNNGVVYCDNQSRINGRIIGGSVVHLP